MILKRIAISSKVVALLLVAGVWCSCNNTDKSAGQAIDSLLSLTFPENEPGAAVVVMRGDSVVFGKGYGLSRLPVTGQDEAGRVERWNKDSICLRDDNRIDCNTSFNIASCSKQFTAVAVLQLAERGLVSLQDPICTYFPELQSDIFRSVTVAHLLSHSSGIPDKRGYLTRQQRIDGDEKLSVEYLHTLDSLHFSAGTDYEYVNPTYVLLGMLVERISGKEFTEYMRNNIFLPAGMSLTSYFDRNRQYLLPDMAHGYEYGELEGMSEERTAQRTTTAKKWYECDFGEETFFATRPDGGIYTSANQLVLWERALRNALAGADGAIVDGGLLKDAMSVHTKVTGSRWSDYQNRPDTYYGYGWFVEPSKQVIYHTGDNGGFKAYIGRYPNLDMTVIILSNRTDWDRYHLKTQIEQLLPNL